MNEYVSIVMPLYNEEGYIKKCLDSLLLQDYSLDLMEWIFVDGGSTDRTKDILCEYQAKYPKLIQIYDNPHKTVPYAMNIGIEKATGKYIIRLDAHSDYQKDYIRKCVYYLNKTGADNVGGVEETKSKGTIGKAIALMLSSKFGVGNSQFRTNGISGYVDTVPFGAFRREVFEKWGGYDERLTRNQDNEMNYRIRKNGGKIYLSNEIRFSYYCRDSLKGICDMAVKNGMWNVITRRLCPGSMGMRHFIPLLFLLSLIFMPLFGILFIPIRYLFGTEIALYFLLDIYFSLKQKDSIKSFFLLLILFPAFHISYGAGSLLGLYKLLFSKI